MPFIVPSRLVLWRRSLRHAAAGPGAQRPLSCPPTSARPPLRARNTPPILRSCTVPVLVPPSHNQRERKRAVAILPQRSVSAVQRQQKRPRHAGCGGSKRLRGLGGNE